MYVRDYTKPNYRGRKLSVVVEEFGKSIYFFKYVMNEVIYKRLVDQIIKVGSFFKKVGIKSLLEESL